MTSSESNAETTRIKPLTGTVVVEVGGIGPGPFAGMVLAGMGATVHRIERPGATDPPRQNALLRDRIVHNADLKDPAGLTHARNLVAEADALYECFRPGVMERFGLGPEDCLAFNPGLVYARMTGWGQHGPYAHSVGHDINYLAISGVLNTIGEPGGPPVAPVNYVADYGGGGMMLVSAITAGLVRRAATGRGTVADVAMVDGAAMMLADLLSRRSAGDWRDQRGTNAFDGGAPFYRTYATSEGHFMAVGAIEPQFYATFLRLLGLDDVDPAHQFDRTAWDALASRIARIFAAEPQEHWVSVFCHSDACVTPVVDWAGLTSEPHLKARNIFAAGAGADIAPAPAPRFYENAAAREEPGS